MWWRLKCCTSSTCNGQNIWCEFGPCSWPMRVGRDSRRLVEKDRGRSCRSTEGILHNSMYTTVEQRVGIGLRMEDKSTTDNARKKASKDENEAVRARGRVHIGRCPGTVPMDAKHRFHSVGVDHNRIVHGDLATCGTPEPPHLDVGSVFVRLLCFKVRRRPCRRRSGL